MTKSHFRPKLIKVIYRKHFYIAKTYINFGIVLQNFAELLIHFITVHYKSQQAKTHIHY